LGDKGFFVMSDHWFDEFMYEIAVEKRFMPSELLPVLETEPIRLHPWDPMGSLATAS
jgi:bleomycin hydrolase